MSNLFSMLNMLGDTNRYRTSNTGNLAADRMVERMAGARARKAADNAENREWIEERIERLTLVCMAMWSLLQDKTNLTEEDLLERVKMLDLMDGVQDGKATRTVKRCPHCNRPMSPRHTRCLYCGYEELVKSAFDAV
mgnify:CR=1 FL=1